MAPGELLTAMKPQRLFTCFCSVLWVTFPARAQWNMILVLLPPALVVGTLIFEAGIIIDALSGERSTSLSKKFLALFCPESNGYCSTLMDLCHIADKQNRGPLSSLARLAYSSCSLNITNIS